MNDRIGTPPPSDADFNVDLTLDDDGFIVGGTPNQLSLIITYQGETPLEREHYPYVMLSGELEDTPSALMLDSVEARDWQCALDRKGRAQWDFSSPGRFTLRLIPADATLFVKGETLTLTLSQAASSTPPGKAPVRLALADVSSVGQQVIDAIPLASLDIIKTPPASGILNFYADPRDQVWPGGDIMLHWRTRGLANLTLLGNNGEVLAPNLDDTGKRFATPNVTTRYTLKGVDAERREVSRSLTLTVPAPGWHRTRITLSEGDPGWWEKESEAEGETTTPATQTRSLSPVCLANDADSRLWGCFHDATSRRTLVFTSQAPLSGWQAVASVVPAQVDDSPATFAGGKLWLVGGSRIDPNRRGNDVWALDVDASPPRWQPQQPAPWPARMGHGLCVFNDRLWIMGGFDDRGAALNDVWSAGVDASGGLGEWQCHDVAPWSPRCLISPFIGQMPNEKARLWLVGGVTAPLSRSCHADAWTFDGQRWQAFGGARLLNDLIDNDTLVSAAATIHQGLLTLLLRVSWGSEDSETYRTRSFCCTNITSKDWQETDAVDLSGWGGSQAFASQLLSFKQRCLLAPTLTSTPNAHPGLWLRLDQQPGR